MQRKEKEIKNRIFILLISILLLFIFINGCGEKETKPKRIIIPKKLLKKKHIKLKSKKIIKEDKKIHKFIYSLTNERDPFKPFFMKPKLEESVEDNIPETPLTMYNLAQYRLKAIIKSPGKLPLAMVETSDNLGLFFTVGDYIGKEHYRVVSIENRVVTLEKKVRGLLNEIKTETKELTLDNEGE